MDDIEIEATYDALISLIEHNQNRLATIVVGYEDLDLRTEIIARYEAEARQSKIAPYRIILGQEPSLTSGLRQIICQSNWLEHQLAVFTVTGSEHLSTAKPVVSKMQQMLDPTAEQSELDKFYGYLQWTREAMRELRYPVVLWVPREIFLDLPHRSPDFWSWRKAVLRFFS